MNFRELQVKAEIKKIEKKIKKLEINAKKNEEL